MKHFFFKSPNLTLSYSFPNSHFANRRRLRIADILVADEDHASMDAVRNASPSSKCYSPRRLVAWLLAALKPTKDRRVLQRRRKNEAAGDPETPTPTMTNDSKESRQLHGDDTSFKLGVGCGLLYLIAATKNELGKMVELRKEMEMLLQNVKGELQSKDTLLKPMKQSDALVCSITDIPEVSSSNSHFSIHPQTVYVQPESKGIMVRDRFPDYNISEQDECAEEMNELQAEFEFELQRLQLYLDGEASFEDVQLERVKNGYIKDSHSKSHSSSFGEIIMEPQGASSDVSFGVPPVELERRLHQLLEAQLQERITELESALEYTTQRLNEKDIEVTWWEDTAGLITQHVPETSRFTFPLHPETALKLSQNV